MCGIYFHIVVNMIVLLTIQARYCVIVCRAYDRIVWQSCLTTVACLWLYPTFHSNYVYKFESPDVDFASFAQTKGLQSRVRNQTIPIAPAHTKLCINITACNQYVGAHDKTSKTTSSTCL